jgi:hypothetical protein
MTPLLADLRASILYPRQEVESWSNESFVTPLERARLKEYLIAVTVRVKNIDQIERLTVDPEEIADGVSLTKLYCRRQTYLEYEMQLPFLKESASRYERADHDQKREMLLERPLGPPIEPDIALACAEGGIRDWRRMWPEWLEWYYDVEKRVTARVGSALQSVLLETPNPEDKPSPGGEPSTKEPERIPWRDTERALAAHIVDKWQKGEIEASSKRQAVIENADRWIIVGAKGKQKRVNPESLWRNYAEQFH